MIRALLLRILDAGQPGEEALAGVDHDEVHPEVALEGDPQQLRLLLAHQPVVDVDAGQPIADRAMDERRRDRRVDAARQRADDQAVRARSRAAWRVDPVADLGDGRVDEVGRPSRSARRRRCRRRSCAGRRGRAACGRPRGGTGCRTGCASGSASPAYGVESVWAVAWKPSGSRVIESPWLIQTGCSRSRPANRPSSAVMRDVGRAVLAVVDREDVAAELVGHQLRAVADAEDGDPPAPDRPGRVAARRRRRPTFGPPDRMIARVPRRSSSSSGVSWGSSSRVDVELADAPRDQLGELAAEVEDDDGPGGGRGRRRGPVVRASAPGPGR